MNDNEFYYIVDLRDEFRKLRYITFWRANNAGYAFPIPWSGKYTKEQIDAQACYYCERNSKGTLTRFPVLCKHVETFLSEPRPGDIDGNAGPVVLNSAMRRSLLRKVAYIPVEAVKQ